MNNIIEESVLSKNLDSELSEKENRIIDHEAKPFLEWSYQEAFELTTKSKRQKIRENIAIGGGITLGAISVASIYPLGGDFGEVIMDSAGIDNAGARQFVYHFFGITAIIPMVALSCIEAKDLFKKIVSAGIEKGIIQYNRKKTRNVLVVLAYILAAFSALSPMYATIIAFENAPYWLKVITVLAAYIGPLIFKSAAEIRLIDKILDNFFSKNDQTVNKQREILQADLRLVVSFINQLSDEELNFLFATTFNNNRNVTESSSRQRHALKHIDYFFSKSNTCRTIAYRKNSSVNSNQKFDLGRKVFAAVGFCIGAASSFIYYTLAEAATLYLCDFLNITDLETRKILGTITATMAVIPWGCLGAESTYLVFNKIFNLILSVFRVSNDNQKTSRGKRIIATTAVFEGSCASTPPTYLAIQALPTSAWYVPLLIIPAFIGPASIRIMAVARALNEGINWLQSFQADNIKIRRKKLIVSIEKIAAVFERLPGEQIIQLYEELIDKTSLLGAAEQIDERKEESTSKTPLLFHHIDEVYTSKGLSHSPLKD